MTTTREDRNAEEAVSFFPITQAKRSATRQSALTGPGLTSEELKAQVKAGRAYQTQIHENLTITKQGLEHRDTFKHDYLQMRDIARLDNSNPEVDVTLLRPELESPELRLRTAPSFVGLGVLSTDEYTGADGASIDGKDPEYV
ncbi:hypothetical protein ARSEF1564_009377 [Beauveria bassiana]